MTTTLLAVAVQAVTVVLVLLAGSGLSRRWLRTGEVGSIANGLASCGLWAYATFFVGMLGERAVAVSTATVVAASVVVLVVLRGDLRKRVSAVWRWAVLLSALAAAHLAVLFLSTAQVPLFERAATRLVPWQLPSDDIIPALLADWVVGARLPGPLIDDWLPGDRPPLQSGFILQADAGLGRLATWWGLPADTASYAASFVAQLLWMPAMIALLVAIGIRARAVALTIAFLALLPVVFVNELFTWPKLLAAAFVIAAIAQLTAALRGRERPGAALISAGMLAGLAAMTHGGSVFALPLVAALGITLAVRSRGVARTWAAGAAAAGSVVAIAAPWTLVQRLVSPPGDRLLKWHLAGVIQPDSRSFLTALGQQYQSSSLGDLVGARLSNLSRAFDVGLWTGLDVWVPGWADRRMGAEFFETSVALSAAIVPLVVLVVVVATGLLRRRTPDAMTTTSAWLVVGALACVVVWCLVLFLPDAALVHQGSHAWMLLLAGVPFAWLASRWPGAAVGVFVAQAVLSASVMWALFLERGEEVRPAAVVLILASALAAATAVGSFPSVRKGRDVAASDAAETGFADSAIETTTGEVEPRLHPFDSRQ